MGRKKKTEEVPEISTPVAPEVPPVVAEEVENPPVEEKAPVTEPEVQPSAPKTAHEISMSIRDEIKSALQNAPKRNDATTMPAIVNLRCRTGDFHFMMPQFDAKTVQKLWNKYMDRLQPEEFVNYMYTTMGLNPPKLYMFMDIINIS